MDKAKHEYFKATIINLIIQQQEKTKKEERNLALNIIKIFVDDFQGASSTNQINQVNTTVLARQFKRQAPTLINKYIESKHISLREMLNQIIQEENFNPFDFDTDYEVNAMLVNDQESVISKPPGQDQ